MGRDFDRPGPGHRVLPDRVADLRLLRRRSPRRQSLRHVAGRARRAHRQAPLAFPDGAPRSVGLRQHGGAAVDDHPAQRTARRRRGAGRQDRIPVRLQPRHRRTDLADRRAARPEERRARRADVAHTAVPHQPAAVCEAVAHRERDQSVHSHARRAGDMEDADRGGAQGRPLHSSRGGHRDGRHPWRAGRRQLGHDGGESHQRHGLRAEHQRAVDLQARVPSPPGPRRRTCGAGRGASRGSRRAGRHDLRPAVRELPRRKPGRRGQLSLAREHHHAAVRRRDSAGHHEWAPGDAATRDAAGRHGCASGLSRQPGGRRRSGRRARRRRGAGPAPNVPPGPVVARGGPPGEGAPGRFGGARHGRSGVSARGRRAGRSATTPITACRARSCSRRTRH